MQKGLQGIWSVQNWGADNDDSQGIWCAENWYHCIWCCFCVVFNIQRLILDNFSRNWCNFTVSIVILVICVVNVIHILHLYSNCNTLPSQLYKCLYLIFINVLISLMFILPRKRKIGSPSLTPDKTTNYSQTRQNIQRVLVFTLLFKIYSICTEIYHQFVYNLVWNLKDTLFIDFLGKYVLILSHLAK